MESGLDQSDLEWKSVYCSNFEMYAFRDFYWIQKARDLYESARKLEPEVVGIWQSYRAWAKDGSPPAATDHYQGPYFMLVAFAVENLLKAAAIARNRVHYLAQFRKTQCFPKELQKHDLVKLAKLVKLSFESGEEDLMRRLTRSAVWFGRYPVPLDYEEMSGTDIFEDGKEYLISWFGGNDIGRLNSFVSSLPARLNLNGHNWFN